MFTSPFLALSLLASGLLGSTTTAQQAESTARTQIARSSYPFPVCQVTGTKQVVWCSSRRLSECCVDFSPPPPKKHRPGLQIRRDAVVRAARGNRR